MAKREAAKLEADGLFAAAARLLAGRALSAGEVRAKLRPKAVTAAALEEAMLRLKEARFLDDARFAEAYAQRRLEGGVQGKMRVLRDLQSRRVAPGLAEKTVSRVYADADETELVTQFLERKYRRENLPRFFQEEKNVAAAYRRLRAAGFSTGASVRVLKRYSAAADAIEESDQETT